MDIKEYLEYFKAGSIILQVFSVLKDKRWHCRYHEYPHVQTGQLAGSGGIQGLERGTTKRPGIELKSASRRCNKCGRRTPHDMWTGNFSQTAAPIDMPITFQKRVIKLLGSKDVVDNTTRPSAELTIDHKLPMIRWSKNTTKYQTGYRHMSDDDIKRAFQLLKKSNGSVSHNLLKSRSCEHCKETGQRGMPFGINFFWTGNERWAPERWDDPSGCHGCGWYDFDTWRKKLNKSIRSKRE